MLKSAESFRGDCKFFVWMCQIAKNTFYSYVKKHGRSADFPEELPAEETNPETIAADKDMALRIHEILHVIEEPYREVFWMRTFGELSFRDPAEETNPETIAADKDMALRIHEILHVIEEPYREVFWMRTFGELSFREIADIHKKSENWARVTYHRAKMKIKEELE